MKLNKIYHNDWMNNTLSDKSVQLIIADPPYFQVKGDFDFVYKSFDKYLIDVELWAKECKRILADNGTLFWYGNSKKIAYSQIILDRYFNLKNSLIWRKKDSIQYQYYSPNLARTFNTHNERLLMYSNGGWDDKLIEEEIKPFNPFRTIIKEARLKTGLSTIQVAEKGKFYGKVNHGGSVANWENGDSIPTEEQWEKLTKILELDSYENAKQQYDTLKQEYENKRRFFYNPNKYEEVLEFSQEGYKTGKYDHDTCKPETLTRALILTCSRPSETVLIPFAGSGTECAMCVK